MKRLKAAYYITSLYSKDPAMNAPDKISQLFNKFAGREIEVVETKQDIQIGGKTYPITEVALKDQNDPVLSDLRKAAEKAGFKLRVWLPGSMGTMDYRTDRLNVRIEKEADGKYRISPRMNIG